MNIAYHDLVETIKNEVDPDFYYDYWTTNLVADQNEYVMATPDNDEIGMDKISQIGIKYNTTDTVYSLVRFNDPVNLIRTPEWYEANQSQSDPFYLIRDNSVFIYPTPDTSVTSGLRIHGISTPIDLVSGWAESTVRIPRQFHEGIAIGARRNVYARRAKPDMETDSINKFNAFKQQMVKWLRERISEPINDRVPTLSWVFE